MNTLENQSNYNTPELDTVTEPVTSPVAPSSPPERRPLVTILLLIILLLLAVIVGGAWWYWQNIFFVPVRETTTRYGQPAEVPQIKELQYSSTVVYKSQGELWLQVPDSQPKQVTQTGGTVQEFSSSQDASLVAFTYQAPNVERPGFSPDSPNHVSLLNTSTLQSEILMSQTPSLPSAEDSEFVDALISAKLSGDGKQVAITTSQELYIYDTQTRKLNQIFSIPRDPSGGGGSGVFGYSEPIFSPDGSKLTLRVGYYEGSGSMLVDLKTKSRRELPYKAGHGGGQRILGWKNNSQLVVMDTQESLEGGPDYPDLTAVDASTLVQQVVVQTIPDSAEGISDLVMLNDSTGYVLIHEYTTGSQPGKTFVGRIDFAQKELTLLSPLMPGSPDGFIAYRLLSVNNQEALISKEPQGKVTTLLTVPLDSVQE